MHFCTVCQNMYYIRLVGDNEDQLIYYCRKCGHTDDTLIAASDNICVSKSDIKSSSTSYDHILNKYTKLDPTLPRLQNIKCPNASCVSNREEEKKSDEETSKNEILYLRYDDANMKFVYICTKCDTVWKSADDK